MVSMCELDLLSSDYGVPLRYNDPTISLTMGNFLRYLSDYYLPKKVTAPWSKFIGVTVENKAIFNIKRAIMNEVKIGRIT